MWLVQARKTYPDLVAEETSGHHLIVAMQGYSLEKICTPALTNANVIAQPTNQAAFNNMSSLIWLHNPVDDTNTGLVTSSMGLNCVNNPLFLASQVSGRA